MALVLQCASIFPYGTGDSLTACKNSYIHTLRYSTSVSPSVISLQGPSEGPDCAAQMLSSRRHLSQLASATLSIGSETTPPVSTFWTVWRSRLLLLMMCSGTYIEHPSRNDMDTPESITVIKTSSNSFTMEVLVQETGVPQ